MIKLISHRGNLTGRIPNKENSPAYVYAALAQGFDVEVDVWRVDGKFFTGHDVPAFPTDEELIFSPGLWLHAKNLEALDFLLQREVNVFAHNTDQYGVTAQKWIWTCNRNIESKRAVVMCLDEFGPNHPHSVYGVCSDYIALHKAAL